MHEIIHQNIQDFISHYGLDISFKLEKKGRMGKAIINGKEYLIIFRDQPRVKNLRELIPSLGPVNIIVICHKLYSTAQEYLEEVGVSYLEWQGNLYFADWQGEEGMRKRKKKNNFDQRINKSRIKCKSGSIIREALLIEPELLEMPVKELAEELNMGKSTLYFYLSQLKKTGYIKKMNEALEINKDKFNEDEIFENMLVRGSHQLVPHWEFERSLEGNSVEPKGWGEGLRGCKFYDKIDPCENMCERVKIESEKGYLIFISPYRRGNLKSLDKSFRKRFIDWFLRRQERIRS